MRNPELLFAALCSTGCSTFVLHAKENKPVKEPNIILIMADDMGYSDLGFMGSGIETPNIDKMARNGVVFSQFYNAGRSCPTRASLLTGLYAHQTGMGWMTASNLGAPSYTGDLNNQCVTIAQVLKQSDYSCYMTGKWHVTHDMYMGSEGPKHNWPIQRGFDRFFGHLGGGSYFKTKTLTNDNEQLTAPENFYLTTAVTDSTVSIINKHFKEKKEDPFFFYVAYYPPHRPLQALQKDIEKYRGKFMNGWDENRKKRYEQLLKLGIINPNCALSERDKQIPAWADLTQEQKQIWDARMAVYAAQIDCMDQGIGKIISTLDENGELDNTLIFFLSDNGGNTEVQGADLKIEDLPFLGSEISEQSYRINWANVSNTPFREYKHFVHEGGISTPLIAYWPQKIKKTGEVSNQVGHVIDIMPTLLDIANVKYPTTFNEKKIIPMAGKSLASAIIQGKTSVRKPLYFEHEANRAIIDGDWKLVSLSTNTPPYIGKWELYNLKNDRSETINLINIYPKKAKHLSKLWDEWAKKNNVYPLDNDGWYQKIDKNIGAPHFN